VRATPMEDNQSTATFELNNALGLARVVDGENRQIPVSRSQQEPTLKLSFPYTMSKGKPVTLNFTYDGKFTGQKNRRFTDQVNQFAGSVVVLVVSGAVVPGARLFGRRLRRYENQRSRGLSRSGSGTNTEEKQAERTVFKFQYTSGLPR